MDLRNMNDKKKRNEKKKKKYQGRGNVNRDKKGSSWEIRFWFGHTWTPLSITTQPFPISRFLGSDILPTLFATHNNRLKEPRGGQRVFFFLYLVAPLYPLSCSFG